VTLPGGAENVDTTNGLFLISAHGHGDLSASDLVGNDQATMEAVYKDKFVLGGTSVWSNPSGPLGLLFSTLGAIPGVGFATAILSSLVDAIVSILGPIPIIGGIVTTLANFLGLTHTTANSATDIGTNAQYSADTANAGVALLNAQLAGTGTIFTDTFNRAAASNLGASYDRSMGSGPGTWGPDGSGNVVWAEAGSALQSCLDRVTAAMTTKYQSIATVLTAKPRLGNSGADSRIRLALRMNAAKNTFVQATLGPGTVELGYVNSGTYTRLGAAVTVPMANGDLWEFRAGTAADDYEFVLLQNNLTVCNRLDSSHLSLAGSSPATWVGTYDYGAIIANAGAVVSFFLTFQINAPTIQVLTVADRTP
jgi:hypothetical protein